MDSKIFLGKYRVPASEMEAVGEIAESPLDYEAEEIDSGKKVVVEVVPAASLKAAARERLEAEAIAAKKLSHVNIPALYDFGVEDNHLVYVTEDFEGTLAEEWVKAHGPMPAGPVLRIASQVVSALGAAAFHRINHHAINPSNLVLVPGQTAEGEWPLVKVLHFVGVAPKVSGTDVAVAAFDKSLHYASPEQIQKGTVDFRSELYSLGATMWFLLTGAPPLVAPAGSKAAPPATTGVAAEKIDAMPKKIRRLLAQMLAADPDARPRDPLAFYRNLQECLHQVERRETMARRFGIPSFSPAGVPGRRRNPVKALALAALFLALAALAALVVSKQVRHRRIVSAEEPIGKPIGVPEAPASVAPVTANTSAIASNTSPPTTAVAESDGVRSLPPTNAPLAPVTANTNAIASNTAPPTTAVAEGNTLQSAPLTNAESAPANSPLPSKEPVVIASTRQVEVSPAPPAASDSSKDLPPPEPAPAAANNPASLPAVTESREVASSKQPEPTPAESPDAKPATVAQKTAPKKTVMREVRRAEPADDEPEVRHAEPAPPEEGPKIAASDVTAPVSEPRVPAQPLAKNIERPVKPKRQAETKTQPAPPEADPETAAFEATASESEPRVVEKSPTKRTERPVKPKRQVEKKTSPREPMSSSERAIPRLPKGSEAARFIGVTPEGWWMLESPSGKIIIVPPPSSR